MFCEFEAGPDNIRIREKEFWDGSVMKDETEIFSFADFAAGKTDPWITEKLGTKTLSDIRKKMNETFAVTVHSEKALPDKKSPEAEAGTKAKKKPLRRLAALIFLLFGLWLVWFPGSRLFVSVPQRFIWKISESRGTVTASGIRSYQIYGKNTRSTGSNSWMSFRYAPEGKTIDVRLENVDYDSTISGSNPKTYWLNTYPPGKETGVYYYAGHPQYASLSRSSLVPGIGWMLLDLLILLFGMVCIYLSAGVFMTG